MKTALEFLKEKGMIKEGHSQFTITGKSFGTVQLVDLLEEFAGIGISENKSLRKEKKEFIKVKAVHSNDDKIVRKDEIIYVVPSNKNNANSEIAIGGYTIYSKSSVNEIYKQLEGGDKSYEFK